MQDLFFKNRRLSVAPMMDWTDRHCRYFHRLLTASAVLYTEMVTTGAVLHGDRDHLLEFHEAEHPLALQLGGSDPVELAECARIAAARGYDEINLNVGCPSDRVQKGRFGACLMREPELVRDSVRAMLDAVEIPVTVKTRLGVDELDSYGYFSDFIDTVAESGCSVFAVHARKAWLDGLSPKQNRDIPELRYDWVYRLKREMPHLQVILNGGVKTASEVMQHLEHVDGVMLGRAAYQNPWVLSECEQALAGSVRVKDRASAVQEMTRYARAQMAQGVPLKHISRHMLGLYQGLPGARYWRRYISEHAHLDGFDEGLFVNAMAYMRSAPNHQRTAA
jgi:tRNA-dihydrouridine synthase A